MRWLLLPITYVRVFIATLNYPEKMPAEQRQWTIELIKRLAALQRMDTSISKRYEFSPEIIDQAPRQRGVYHFFEGVELKYIGASCTGLYWRLRGHYRDSLNWAAGNTDKVSNKGLGELIASGRASVEWYESPFPGWVEECELTEYCEEHGGPPPLNSRRRSNLINRCLW
jgi:hypothetical protein